MARREPAQMALPLHPNVSNMTFVHVPKTGGTSVEAFLSARRAVYHRFRKPPSHPWLSPWHFPADLLQVRYGMVLDPPRFCVVRDPVERYAWCEAWSNGRFRASANEIATQALEWKHPTEELLYRIPQHMFVFSRTGELQCECVVAFEKLALLLRNGVVNNKSGPHGVAPLPTDFQRLYRLDERIHRAARVARGLCYTPPRRIEGLAD